MPKKVTIDLLNDIAVTGNVVDDLLDKEMEEIERRFGTQYEGLSNKILTLFVQPGGQRVQLSEEEITSEMEEKRQVEKRVVWQILDHLESAGILRCTNRGHYELANNMLAQRAGKKVEADNRILRNMEVVIRDRMGRNELLDEKYLNYILPSIPLLELTPEEEDFIERSKESVRSRRRLRSAIMWTVIVVLLGLSIWAISQTIVANRRYNLLAESTKLLDSLRTVAEGRAEDYRVQKEEAEELEKQALKAAYEADSLRRIAELKVQEALAAKAEAEQEREKAEIERLKAEKAQSDALAASLRAQDAAENANKLLREAQAAEERANNNLKMLNDVNQSIVALNAAVRSMDIEDAQLRSLISRQAYRLYTEAMTESRRKNNPFIFRSLYYAVKALIPKTAQPVLAHKGAIQDILMHPSGDTFYTASSDGRVKAWTIQSWNKLGAPNLSSRELNGIDRGYVYRHLALSRDGQYLLVGGEMDRLQIYSFADNYVNTNLFFERGFKDKIDAAGFDRKPQDGQPSEGIIAMGFDNYYLSWGDLQPKTQYYQDFQRLNKLSSRANTIVEVDGQVYGLTSSGRYQDEFYQLELQVLDNREMRIDNRSIRGSAKELNYGAPTAIGAAQEGTWGMIAVGFQNGQLFITPANLKSTPIFQDSKTSYRSGVFLNHKAAITDITFSKNGQYLAVSSLDGTVTVWDLRSFMEPSYQPLVLDDHDDWVQSLTFANNDRFLVAGSQNGKLHFWNILANDYAETICSELQKRSDYPNFDNIATENWDRFFGANIDRKPVCK